MNMFATIEHTTDKIEPKDTDIESFNYDVIKTKVIEGAGSTDADWENALEYVSASIISATPSSIYTNERGEIMRREYIFWPSKESFVAPGDDQARQIYKVYIFMKTLW